MDKDKEIARLTDIAIEKAERCDEYYVLALRTYQAFVGPLDAGHLNYEQECVIRDIVGMLMKVEDEAHEHNSN